MIVTVRFWDSVPAEFSLNTRPIKITRTAIVIISSISVKAFFIAKSVHSAASAGYGRNNLNHRQEHRDYDSTDDASEEDDERGLDRGGHTGNGVVDFVVVRVSDTRKHFGERAGLFADLDHRNDHRREYPALRQRLRYAFTLFNGVVNRLDSLRNNEVSGRVAHDDERLKNRHARRKKRSQRSRKAGNRRSLDESADYRHLQLYYVEYVSALGGLCGHFHQYVCAGDDGKNLKTVLLDILRRLNNELRNRRQRLPTHHILKDVLEFGNNRNKKERRDADRGKENDDRINHRTLHLILDLIGLFGEFGESPENDFENTARFTGLYHVDVKVVEDFRISRKRFGERAASGNRFRNAIESFTHLLILDLTLKNVDTAHQGKTGVDERRELAGELS